MPTISIFVPETDEGIYEFKLIFDDHGYQETLYREYQEICFCALSTILPELSEDEIITLYSDLHAQTAKNFWMIITPIPMRSVQVLKSCAEVKVLGFMDTTVQELQISVLCLWMKMPQNL